MISIYAKQEVLPAVSLDEAGGCELNEGSHHQALQTSRHSQSRVLSFCPPS